MAGRLHRDIFTIIIPFLDQRRDRLSFLLTCRLFASLQPFFDPSADDNYAIKWAAERGNIAVVKLLLKDPRVGPSICDDEAIQLAAKNGHITVVELLLKDKRVDPSAGHDWAIRLAAGNGHTPIVKLLLKDSRVQGTLSEEDIEAYTK